MSWRIVAKNFPSGKALLQELAMPAVVILVAIAAFGLGRLSALQEQKGTLKVYAPGEPQTLAEPTTTEFIAAPIAEPAAKNFVASKNGTKYYTAGCSGASRINSENQVWFATAADAQAAGFTLASGCGN